MELCKSKSKDNDTELNPDDNENASNLTAQKQHGDLTNLEEKSIQKKSD